MKITADTVCLAYKKLKSFVYYDKTDLFLRKRIAEFECNVALSNEFELIAAIFNEASPVKSVHFNLWLNQIRFRLVPKQICTKEEKQFNDKFSNTKVNECGKYINNITSSSTYYVNSVNYFFDGPIQLHIVAVLWLMSEGVFLDELLDSDCYGSRLAINYDNANSNTLNLFKRYHELYSQWRDSGIAKAKSILVENKKNVFILGLDIQEFYYRLRPNYDGMARKMYCDYAYCADMSISANYTGLFDSLIAINNKFMDLIRPHLKITHPDIAEQNCGIPIGLCSSPLIANWHLNSFDTELKEKLNPDYYGRYVDDILIVLSTHTKARPGHCTEDFINQYFVDTGIFTTLDDGRYEIKTIRGLFLQKKKCILQYFDVEHSIAGLEKFKKKLEESASNFLLMPVDEADNSLEDVAYDLLYEGSINKFRSVKGMAENKFELAKHLAKQTIFHLITQDKPNKNAISGLQKFFKGINSIEFYDLWERVITYFIVSRDYKSIKQFIGQLKKEVSKIKFETGKDIQEQLKSNLMQHLEYSMSLALSLDSCSDSDKDWNYDLSSNFRESNLVRHHYVSAPMVNYTSYKGSYIHFALDHVVELEQKKVQLSPRYVNFDEAIFIAELTNEDADSFLVYEKAVEIYGKVNGQTNLDVKWIPGASGEFEHD